MKAIFLLGLFTFLSMSAFAQNDHGPGNTSIDLDCLEGHIRGTTTVHQERPSTLKCLKISTLGNKYVTNDAKCIEGYLQGVRNIPGAGNTFGKGLVHKCIKEDSIKEYYKTSENCGEGFIDGRMKTVSDSGFLKIIKTCLKLDTLGEEYKTSSNKCIDGYSATRLHEYSAYDKQSSFIVCTKN